MPTLSFARSYSLPDSLSVGIIDRVAQSDLSHSFSLYEMQSQPSIDIFNLAHRDVNSQMKRKKRKWEKEKKIRSVFAWLQARIFGGFSSSNYL